MKIQNNRTKTATTIMGALAIGLMMLTPIAMLPNVGAQQDNVAIKDAQPPHAIELNQEVAKELMKHHGDWVGIVTWGPNNDGKIVYLGPKSTNPYHKGIHASPCSPPCQNAAGQIQPTSYPYGGSYTQPAEIDQSFTAKASTNTAVDMLMNLNAWNGANTDWIQSVALYNIAGEGGLTSNKWYAEMDSTHNNGTEDSGFPMSLQMTVNGQSDSFAEHLYNIQPGCYEAEVDDNTSGNGYSFSDCYHGDNTSYMLLTHELITQNGVQKAADSGSMTEDSATDTAQTYEWGSIQYNLGFRNTVLGTQYTTVNGWTSNNPFNPADGDTSSIDCALTITTGTNNAATDTMNYCG